MEVVDDGLSGDPVGDAAVETENRRKIIIT
jgi:hypothetical protein